MYLFMSLILAAKLGIVWDCLLLAVGEFPDFPIIFGSPAFGQFKGDNNCNCDDDHQDHERVMLIFIFILFTTQVRVISHKSRLCPH